MKNNLSMYLVTGGTSLPAAESARTNSMSLQTSSTIKYVCRFLVDLVISVCARTRLLSVLSPCCNLPLLYLNKAIQFTRGVEWNRTGMEWNRDRGHSVEWNRDRVIQWNGIETEVIRWNEIETEVIQ